jgi:hypothetical protein
MKKYIGVFLVFIQFFSFIGCSQLRELKYTSLPRHEIEIPNEYINKVPYIAQNDTKSCATTSAAMAISFFEKRFSNPLDKEKSWEISGAKESDIKNHGNDMDSLRRLVNYYGYNGEFVQNLSIQNIEYLIAHGALIVLNIKLNKSGSQTHAILAVGYNKSEEMIYFVDPAGEAGNYKISYKELESIWEAGLSHPNIRSKKSGFIIYPRSI